MTATSLQFGPEWMRTKQTNTAPSSTRSPTALLSPAPQNSIPSGPAGTSSYSSLLAPPAPAPTEKQESVDPFMYSKEDMLQVWRDGGGRGGLGLEVELWEGIVKEIGGEPMGLKEISDVERKLFSLPLNSDLRRRQSHDYLPNPALGTGDRPKLPHSGSSSHGPLNQQRFGGLGGRRRKDEDNGPPPSSLRRPSLSSANASLGVPTSPTAGTFPSSRAKHGGGSNGTDGVANAIEGNWRRRDADVSRLGGSSGGSHDLDKRDEEKEREEKMLASHPDPNGSFKDPDMSRSASDRSVVPSSSFVRDSLAQTTKEVIAKLGDVSLTDENKSSSLSGSLGTITEGNNVSTVKGEIPVSKPPGIEEDPTSISWSYRDPRGIIQGPFAANLMQKWYDEGYFTPDLLVKRTHLDTDWMPVGELRRCADNEKLFFSSFVDHGPPGLGPRPPAPSLNGQSFDHLGQPMGPTAPPQGQHPSPDVPASSRFLNPATTTQPPDSFFGTSSNPSDSPASTFNTSIAPIQAASPETPFGVGSARSMFGNNGLEPPIGRIGPFDSQPTSLGVRGGSAGFNANDDPSYTTRMQSLGNREGMFDSQGFTNFGMSATPTSPWGTGISGSVPREADAPGVNGVLPTHRATLNNSAFSPATNAPGFSDLGSNESTVFRSDAYNYVNAGFSQVGRGTSSAEGLSSNFGPIGPTAGIRDHSLLPPLELDIAGLNNRTVSSESVRAPGGFGNSYTTTSPVIPTPNFGMTANQAVIQQNPHSLQNIPSFNQSPMPTTPLTTFQPHQQPVANLPLSQPSWGAAELPVQPRPLPFNAPHPTSHNVTTTPIPSDLAPNAIQQASDPYNTSRSEIGERWSNISTVPTAQVAPQERSVDSDQGQQSGWSLPPSVDDVTEQVQAPRPDPSPSPPQPAPPSQVREPEPQAATAPKKRGSGPAQAAQPPVSKAPPAAAVIPPPPQTSASAPPAKSAWTTSHTGTEDEVKPQKQIGLREIQEAETKRAEAKKIAERERERAARAHSSAEEAQQMYTASWGLPTSQAGASRTAPKEQPPAPPAPTPAHVWTNTGKPPQVKRTMKEIQEEEERRKKAAERETAAAAARRAYAESANKSTSTPSGGGWTTVGAGGKQTPNPAVARHIPGAAPSSSAAARTSNGVSAARPSPQNAKQSALKLQPASDDSPIPPSPEFMKWLREAVRGFNPGFNTEEFMAMLLTFSLDFPPSTVEMIQDMVYMNSATLDGRRFAADFCSKRKADAANRPKATTTGKAPSLADVVKTQPKPAQADLEFKIVKKKGRGNAR